MEVLELLQGVALTFYCHSSCCQVSVLPSFTHLKRTSVAESSIWKVLVHKQTAFGVRKYSILRVKRLIGGLYSMLLQLTSWGLSCFARGARLPLIGVRRAVQLWCSHVEEQSFLKVVQHSQAIAISKHHTIIQLHKYRVVIHTITHTEN